MAVFLNGIAPEFRGYFESAIGGVISPVCDDVSAGRRPYNAGSIQAKTGK
ncbi:hypothetical protein [Acinetobacter bouvetii]|nr:hypothetical protein [Acinetobacter bouvetii]